MAAPLLSRRYSLVYLFFISVLLLPGCASVPQPQPLPPIAKRANAPVVDYALTLEGIPYRWGKASPQEGFDCSGFVQHVYKQQGVALPRTVREMAVSLPIVPKNTLSSGDLLFFNTAGDKISHVGLYICDSKFIHAPSQRTGKVTISSLQNPYWRKHFMGVRRPTALR